MAKRVLIRGGDGLGDGGVWDATGKIRGHYWLEVDIDNESYVVDLTADQFGHPPCIILLASKAKEMYLPGNQEVIDQHVREFMDSIGASC